MNTKTNLSPQQRTDSNREVSAIIPAFNASETIGRAIESVMIQQVDSIEIIIVDDGSTDSTWQVLTTLAQANSLIRLIKMQENRGVSAARNAGIQAANGKFLAFLDADDVWLPGKLKKQLAEIYRDPSISLVSCNSKLVSESGEFLKEGHKNRPPVEGANAWKTLLIYNFIPTPTVLTYRHLVLELGGFDENLQVGEDLDLWIRLALRGKVIVLNEILINYFDSAGSLMKRHHAQSQLIVFPMLEKHLEQQKVKLSLKEQRNIRGQRSFQTGCNLFFADEFQASIPLFMKAIASGTRPVKSLTYIPRALLMMFYAKCRR